MPIETNNLVIYGPQRNTDTDDGGGQYNGQVVKDGESNNVFDDVSEMDRTMGDVSMRKIFPAVNTNDTDKLMGAYAFIAKNPTDPNVSACLFSTKDWTDQRSSAQNRVESYLAKGSTAIGTLLDTAYAGMKQIQTIMFSSETAYGVGTALVLVQNENTSTQQQQFVLITAVSTRTAKMVVDGKEVEYQIATYTINDALSYDFIGLSAKQWYNGATSTTLLRETIVADTGKYYASTDVTVDIAIGDTVVHAQTMYGQLIPSAQSENPITDINIANEDPTLVAGNDKVIAVTKNITISASQNCYLGSAVYPSSLNFTLFGASITDKGGELFNSAGTSVGTVDYQSGLIKWSSSAGAGTASINFNFQPAVAPTRPQQTALVTITAENRAANYTRTLAPIPSPGSLKVSYVAQGKVYTLQDNGSGALKGSNSAFGSGTINYTTGTVLLTCGALPDVGSGILLSWGQNLHLYDRADMSISKAYVPLTFDADTIVSGSLIATWKVNGVDKKATDDGTGNFTGDATGLIEYGKSTAKLIPNELLNGGTEINIVYDKGTKSTAALTGSSGGEIIISGSGAIKPGSVALTVQFDGYYTEQNANGAASGITHTLNYYDKKLTDTTGQLVRSDTGAVHGTIKYADRSITISPSDGYSYYTTEYAANLIDGMPDTETTTRKSRTDTPLNGAIALVINYRDTSTASTSTTTVTASELCIDLTDGYTETMLTGSLRFVLGTSTYIDRAGMLYRDPSVTDGSATYAGTLQYSGGLVKVTSWNTGDTNSTTLQSLVTTMDTLKVSKIAFRSAVMPLRSESVTIQATRADGGTITITPPASGVVDTATVSGSFSWDYGMGQFIFRDKTQITDSNRATIEAKAWYDKSLEYTEESKTYINAPIEVVADSVTYSAVGYTYIPLDAEILGLSATRLPTDGRVPIFRVGDIAVVCAFKSYQLPDVTVGSTYQLDDQRISYCELEDSTGTKVDTSMYVVDYDYGRFTIGGDFAIGELKTPLYAKYRYQDLGLVNDVQIDGQITLTKPLTHKYSTENSIVGSALVIGDMYSRYTGKFTQVTWNDVWSDTSTGTQISANYNDTLYPIEVTNKGAIQERWAIVFTNSGTAFKVVGEYSGQIGTGTINSDCAPINPVTNAPYFTIRAEGWGLGWASGNVLRFNTKASTYPIWCIRTVQQSEPTVLSDQFQIMLSGDIDRTV